MSAETPENGGSEQEKDPYDPAVLRQLVPGTLQDGGQRALVCAIRNPYASTTQVAEKCGLSSTFVVENALRSAVQEADREAVQYGQHLERRNGEVRNAETYGELTEKQQTIIDFTAANPVFTEERTWADVAQAIHEQEGVVVNETYVGEVLRKYDQIYQQQKALAATEGENEVELEDAISEMTMAEVLGAAGYDLPGENLDSMPVDSMPVDSMPEMEGAREQATVGEARDTSGDFQSGSEVQQAQDEQRQEARSLDWLSPEWQEAHAHLPGAEQAQRLPDEADDEDVKGGAYWAYVNGVASYGVFVSLTKPEFGDDVSGLVMDERLYGSRSEYERGDAMVVELDHRNGSGLAFTDWRIAHPDEVQERDDSEQEADDEADEDSEGEGTGLYDLPEDDVLAALDQRVANQGEQMEVLAERIRSLREDAVMASEVGQFATEVEDRLDDLREDVAEMEGLAGEAAHLDEVQAVQQDLDGYTEATNEELGRHGDRLDTLQEMVNGLAEQVERATTQDGSAGRAQRALQRLEAEVQAYRYSEQDGTVTLHLEATLPEAEQEDADNE